MGVGLKHGVADVLGGAGTSTCILHLLQVLHMFCADVHATFNSPNLLPEMLDNLLTLLILCTYQGAGRGKE